MEVKITLLLGAFLLVIAALCSDGLPTGPVSAQKGRRRRTKKWKPRDSDPSDTRTAEEWGATHGWTKDQLKQQKKMLKKCKKLMARSVGFEVSEDAIKETEFLDDIILSLDQTRHCVKFLKEKEDKGKGKGKGKGKCTEKKKEKGKCKDDDVKDRRKRKMLPIDRQLWETSKWDLPIRFQFDGDHNDQEEGVILQAIDHWQSETCIRFKEIAEGETYSKPHILISRNNGGCWSYVGKIGRVPQALNLGQGCIYDIGTPAHELGHAIGFWHEQSRTDRDEYISIRYDNITEGFEYNFAIASNINNFSIPYDMGSVMHYGTTGFAKKWGLSTLLPNDMLYRNTMGQRIGLSFFDTKIINEAYCQGICTEELPCLRGGYTNPNNCLKCKCPEGFGGKYCEEVQTSDAECGRNLIQVTDTVQYIESPNYGNGRYSHRTSCNWHLQAPAGCSVEAEFDSDFGVFCNWWDGACQHWVEIKYDLDLQKRGPRFCCDDRPTAKLVSQGNEMMVIFRTTTLAVQTGTGFRLRFNRSPGCSATTPQTTTSETTTSDTTTPPTAPETTTPEPTDPETTTPEPTTPETTTPEPTDPETTTPESSTTTTATPEGTTSSPVLMTRCYNWSDTSECRKKKKWCGMSRRVRLCEYNNNICRWERQLVPCRRKCGECTGKKCTECCSILGLAKPIKMWRQRSCSKKPSGIPKFITKFITKWDIDYNMSELPEPTWEIVSSSAPRIHAFMKNPASGPVGMFTDVADMWGHGYMRNPLRGPHDFADDDDDDEDDEDEDE